MSVKAFRIIALQKLPAGCYYSFTSSCVYRIHKVTIVNSDVTAVSDKNISATRAKTGSHPFFSVKFSVIISSNVQMLGTGNYKTTFPL